MTAVYVGLGSNLEDPREQVRRALHELDGIPATRVTARSPLYKSAPLGPQDQPDYINAVATLDTGLAPLELLAALRDIEVRHGRHRDGTRWGPRSLDLDILVYGDLVMHTPELTLPHPGLPERAFVLYPLHDVAPQLAVPGKGTVSELRELISGAPPLRLDD